MLDAIRDEVRWVRHNLKTNDWRMALATLVWNVRWRVGYAIGPFRHACAGCPACLD